MLRSFWINWKYPLPLCHQFGLCEVGNVLLVAERKKRISQADSARFIALLRDLPIVIEQEPSDVMFGEILALAREHRLSTYDASYLDLAMRKGLPIATLDNSLIAAGQTEPGSHYAGHN